MTSHVTPEMTSRMVYHCGKLLLKNGSSIVIHHNSQGHGGEAHFFLLTFSFTTFSFTTFSFSNIRAKTSFWLLLAARDGETKSGTKERGSPCFREKTNCNGHLSPQPPCAGGRVRSLSAPAVLAGAGCGGGRGVPAANWRWGVVGRVRDGQMATSVRSGGERAKRADRRRAALNCRKIMLCFL